MFESLYTALKIKEIRWLAIIVALSIGYDYVWHLLASLFHSLAVLAHYLFELCEHGLDVVVEHLFHTSPRTTEIIVFYIMATLILALFYQMLRMLPRWYCRLCEQFDDYLLERKKIMIRHWEEQDLGTKVTWCSVFISSSLFMLMLAFN